MKLRRGRGAKYGTKMKTKRAMTRVAMDSIQQSKLYCLVQIKMFGLKVKMIIQDFTKIY